MSLFLDSIIVNNNIHMSVGNLEADENTDMSDYYTNKIMTLPLSRFDKKYVTSKNEWIENTILNTYPSRNCHYIVDNKMYMCIQNNNNQPCTTKPVHTSLFNEKTDDGYVWRYLFTVQSDDMVDYMNIFNSEGVFSKKGSVAKLQDIDYTSITFDSAPKVQTISTNGKGLSFDYVYNETTKTISQLFVSNGGSNYNKNDVVIISDNIEGAGAEINLTINNGEIQLDTFEPGGNYNEIKAFVVGDGTGAELECITQSQSLHAVNIVNSGTGYTWARVVITNSNNSIMIPVILEPYNGIGYNLYDDLPISLMMSKIFKVDVDTEINYVLIHSEQITNEIPRLYILNNMNNRILNKESDNKIQVVIEEEIT